MNHDSKRGHNDWTASRFRRVVFATLRGYATQALLAKMGLLLMLLLLIGRWWLWGPLDVSGRCLLRKAITSHLSIQRSRRFHTPKKPRGDSFGNFFVASTSINSPSS
jgi:hypothetical protein